MEAIRQEYLMVLPGGWIVGSVNIELTEERSDSCFPPKVDVDNKAAEK